MAKILTLALTWINALFLFRDQFKLRGDERPAPWFLRLLRRPGRLAFRGELSIMLFPLELARDRPLQRQLYEQMRDLVVSARLAPGTRMPSTRMMAEQFGVARITVLLTYERLVAEGYLETRPARGTFVRHLTAQPCVPPQPARAPHILSVIKGGHHGDSDGGAYSPAPARPSLGEPDPSLFPVGRWRGLMRNALDHLGAQVRSEHPAGHPALRQAIADWLSTSRGLAVAPDQVLLLNGRQQALHLVAHLAITPHARAVVEDPCDDATAATLSGEGADLMPIPVDADGLRTDLLPAGPASLVCVSPEHQRPLGATLSRSRRLALLDWARQSGALVLEEDCEGELRYGEFSQPALMSLDTTGQVIVLGGFGTSLGPWVSLAFLVLPRRLIADALCARRLIDDRKCSLEETALAELMHSGGYARHLHRLSRTYANRRDTMLAALQQQFGDTVPPWGGHAGLNLTWFPPADAGSCASLAALARRCGLEAVAAPFGGQGEMPDGEGLMLGFGALPEEQIKLRIGEFARLARACHPVRALSAD
jgi:GntR family transcriptional regulator/MocR family aminotransferase